MIPARSLLAAAVLCALSSSAYASSHHHRGLPWCGIYLSKYFGKTERRLWIAREWATVGTPAGGPAVGTIVVWPHHVGVIQGRANNGQWVVHSGNDGGAVRTRPRSVSGAIAFRWP